MTLADAMKAANPPGPFKRFTKAEWRAYLIRHTWFPVAVIDRILAGPR